MYMTQYQLAVAMQSAANSPVKEMASHWICRQMREVGLDAQHLRAIEEILGESHPLVDGLWDLHEPGRLIGLDPA